VGQDEKRLVAREQELGSVSLGPKLALLSAPFSPLSLCPFHQISIKSREACISDFLQLFVPFGPRCLPNMAANLDGESSDISHTEKLCFHYVDKLQRICERFLGVVHVSDIVNCLLRLQLYLGRNIVICFPLKFVDNDMMGLPTRMVRLRG
jgi:hypothetical protein